MFDSHAKYKIHWELTNLCNLKCPMCPRTDAENFCRPVKALRKAQFFLEDVKQYLPDRFLRKLRRIDFCGNFGDPCMPKDFYKICEYLIKAYGIKITVSTNGSMKNPSWWKEVGKLFADAACHIDFHIDGLEDTNHLYRIGANWHKIMSNIAAFISGGGRANWVYILFKHNQHQIDEAQRIANMMGFNAFVSVDTGRFPESGKFRYMHPDGYLCHLEEAETAASHAPPGNTLLEVQTPSSLKARNRIVCKASKSNRFYLDADGYIAPCCWISNSINRESSNIFQAVTNAGKTLDDFNILNRPIEKILKDDVFAKGFKDLWKSDSLSTCLRKCGKRHRNIQSKIQFDL